MKTGDTMRTAFRIWLITILVNGLVIGIWIGEWGVAFAAVVVGTIVTLPIPFVAYYFLKLAVAVSKSFASRFTNTIFFLVVVAALFWVILISGVDSRNIFEAVSKDPVLPLLIASNFLSILLACFCSIEQIKRLDDVTSEETVIS